MTVQGYPIYGFPFKKIINKGKEEERKKEKKYLIWTNSGKFTRKSGCKIGAINELD